MPSLAEARSAPAVNDSLQRRASWLKAKMVEQGLTQYKLALVAHLDKNTIKKILEGKAVTRRVLDKLAAALSESVDEIPS